MLFIKIIDSKKFNNVIKEYTLCIRELKVSAVFCLYQVIFFSLLLLSVHQLIHNDHYYLKLFAIFHRTFVVYR